MPAFCKTQAFIIGKFQILACSATGNCASAMAPSSEGAFCALGVLSHPPGATISRMINSNLQPTHHIDKPHNGQGHQ